MEDYIKGNKEAWEEAFSNRKSGWGEDITERIPTTPYAFFHDEMISVLKKYNLKGKSIGQFCCNNGRELLSLVHTVKASEGTGFDIAENQIAFAKEKANELSLPCHFVQGDILSLPESYQETFDFVYTTIGVLCWFKNLREFFRVVARSMKPGASIVIHEQHPFTNMVAYEGDKEYCKDYPANFCFSYFDHTWINNGGMYYLTGKSYESKTFTDFTHSISEIIRAMYDNGLILTDMQEFENDISGGCENLSGKGFPLSMILTAKKEI